MKIGIYGYGNLGKAVEKSVERQIDAELVAIFTRREPSTVGSSNGSKVHTIYDILRYKEQIDVMIVCGGSAVDLPNQTPVLARSFNLVDAFDTHKDIPTHFEKVDESAREYGNTALICGGWDPGVFSVFRCICSSVMPKGKGYTFWGEGVSQGHSQAIRQVFGVKDAIEYTLPNKKVLFSVKNGENPEADEKSLHARECFIVPEENADLDGIERTIKNMPHYFEGYETRVHFISQSEMDEKYNKMRHSGTVIYNSKNSDTEKSQMSLSVAMDSNPDFTADILLAYARAVMRMSERGEIGCKTVLDVAPRDLSPMSENRLRRTIL